jgi:hypothetical protein
MKKSSAAPSNSSLKVVVYWGDILYDTVICHPNDSVTLGRKPEDTFVMDMDSLKLVEVRDDNSADLHFNDGIDGHVRIGKELFSLQSAIKTDHVKKDDKGVYHVRMGQQDKADFVVGHVSFYLDWLKDLHPVERSKRVSKKGLIIGLAALLAFLVSLGAVFLITPAPEQPPQRLVTLLPRNAPAKAAMGERKSQDGGSQKGELGKANTAVSEKPSAVAQLKSANLGNLVSGLSEVGSNAPSVTGPATNTTSFQQVGTGGFSNSGAKNGGGGKTVGLGRAVGNGEGGFEGTGRLGLSGDSTLEGGTGHGTGDNISGGGLDHNLIESIIRRRLDRIRLCYERQLNFNPKLAGKIAVHFVIGKSGEVLSSRTIEDTMKNEQVKTCVLSEVSSWNFPAPEGGTLVNVDYPFVFESSARN